MERFIYLNYTRLYTFVLVFFLMVLSTRFVFADLNIVTSLPDFAAIAREIGGDKVKVESIAKGYQDPHFVDAKPSYIMKLNRADMLVYNGLDLEIGWLPILVTGSRNSKITSTESAGNLDASTLIPNILEVPVSRVDRSMGDVHPYGNPHYLLDPRNGIIVARGITEKLKRIDPDNATFYEENYLDFSKRLDEKIKEWEEEFSPFKGTEVVTYHKSWVYFTNWAGFKEVGYIEPKPGIPPTPSHVAELINNMKNKNVKLIIEESFYPQKTASIIAQKTGSNFLVLPSSVGAKEDITSYIGLFDSIVDDVTSALKKDQTSSNNLKEKRSLRFCI